MANQAKAGRVAQFDAVAAQAWKIQIEVAIAVAIAVAIEVAVEVAIEARIEAAIEVISGRAGTEEIGIGIPIFSNMRCSPKRAVGTFMNWKILTSLPCTWCRPCARSARPKAAVLLPLPSPVLTMMWPRRSPSGLS